MVHSLKSGPENIECFLFIVLFMEKIMPSNIVQVNYSDKLVWEVADSKMDNLIAYLNKIGDKEKITSDTSSSSCSQTLSQVLH